MRVLGIDPGSHRVGYGLIENGGGVVRAVTYGVLEVPRHAGVRERVLTMAKSFRELLRRTQPERAGLETLFLSKNQKTAMAVAEMRGILLFLLLEHDVPVIECQPQSVKLSVTGYGLADKKSVARMTETILHLEKIIGHDDASDALAIALTAAQIPAQKP